MTPQMTPDELLLWRGFLRWSEGTAAAIAVELAAGSSLSVSDFEVAVRLHHVDSGLIQGVLGASLGWSASRLSHQLSRMEKRGLVDRASSGRGRSVRVTFTAAGRSEFEAAAEVHAHAVRTHFLSTLKPSVAAAISQQCSAARLLRG
jgi:DNA-binding MarR family transcriptional regulator